MSFSGSSDEFSYQTRLVVYNFLGLVPATPSQSDEDEGENSLSGSSLNVRPTSPWNDTLEMLPKLSLIDRLSESETQQMQMKMVCDEVANKVKCVEPPPPSSSSSPGGLSLRNDKEISKDHKSEKNTTEKLDPDEAHQAVLHELKQWVAPRGRSPNGCNNEEQASGTITIIQKRNRVKILGDTITPSEEADIRRRFSLQPFTTTEKSSDAHLGQSSVQLLPQSAPMGGRISFSRRPTTLLTPSAPSADMKKASSREMLSQIDEEHELDVCSDALKEDNDREELSSQEALKSVQHFPTRPLFERQNSSWSASSRRCSTYIDITEVDVESFVKAKTLPSVTLPLKRELSLALEELEKKIHPTDGLNDAKSPESEVADSLRALGDQIQEEYGLQLNLIVENLLGTTPGPVVNYNTLRDVTSQLLQQTQHGWTRVTLVMLLGQHLVYELLQQGYSGISHMAEYTAKLIEDQAADFIINNGGWNSISDIGVVETETLLTPSNIDYRLIPEFLTRSPDVADSPVETVDAALLGSMSLDSETITRSIPEISAAGVLRSSSLLKKNKDDAMLDMDVKVFASSSDHNLPDLFLPRPVMSSSPCGTPLPPNQSIEGEILLLRQNSQQFVDEMESTRRSVVWTQSSTFAGFALMTLLASWLIYWRFRTVS